MKVGQNTEVYNAMWSCTCMIVLVSGSAHTNEFLRAVRQYS
jgi:hypothetical protein